MSERVNINKLGVVTGITKGDFLIVETPEGTRILDYKDFSVDIGHATFSTTVSGHTEDILNNTSLIRQLTANQDTNTSLVSQVSGLTGLMWRDTWSSATTYNTQDIVEYNNSSFVSQSDNNTNNTPVDSEDTLNTTYWNYLAKKGSVSLPLSSASAILSHNGSELVEVKPAGDDEIGYILTSQGISNTPTWSLASNGRPGSTVDKVWTGHIGTKWNSHQAGPVVQMTDGSLLRGGDDQATFGHMAHGPSGVNTHHNGIQPMMFDTCTWVASAQTIKNVSPDGLAVFVTTSAGDCFSTGINETGELGHGDTTNRYILTRIEYFKTNNIAIDRVRMNTCPDDSGYRAHTAMFLTTAGNLYAAGDNGYGSCGIGNTTDQHTPVKVTNIGVGTSPGKVVDFWIGGGYPRVYAKCADGKVYGWGYNASGALGLGDTTNREAPTEISALSGAIKIEVSSNGILYNNGGSQAYEQTIALISDGTVKGAGNDNGSYGIFGTGTAGNLTSFGTVSGIGPGTPDGPVIDIAHSGNYYQSCAALTSGGELYAWGYNGNHQLVGSAYNGNVNVTPIKVSNISGALNSSSTTRGDFDLRGAVKEIRFYTAATSSTYPGGLMTVADASGYLYSAGFNKSTAGAGNYNQNIPAPHYTATYTTAGFEKWILPCAPNEIKQWGFYNSASQDSSEYYEHNYFIVTTTGRMFVWADHNGLMVMQTGYVAGFAQNYTSIWHEVRF